MPDPLWGMSSHLKVNARSTEGDTCKSTHLKVNARFVEGYKCNSAHLKVNARFVEGDIDGVSGGVMVRS